MDMATILGKKKADLNQEEKDHLKKNKSKLTDAQQKEYKDVIGEDADEDEDEKKKASEKKEAEDKADKEKKEASEKAGKQVQISASEYEALKNAADEGKQAYKELQATKLTGEVTALTFSASNKAGRFLPKSETDLKAFMETLKPEQRLAFSTLVAQIPQGSAELFTEKGSGTTATEGTAQAELDAKINAKQAANTKLTYSAALKEVMVENPSLQQRYDDELKPAGGVRA